MKRVVIIAKGEVQRVGYRDAVEKIGRKLKLTGFVENLKPYDVRIVAEGEEEILNAFVAHVRITGHPISPISVEELDVKFGAATREFEYFEIRRGDWQDELGERMDAAGALLYRSLEIGEKMLDKQDKTLEKQDRTIEILEDVREDTGKIRDALPSLREIRSETAELMYKYEVLRMDVDAIKVKLEV
jgi:acylphosphatase